MALSSTQLLQPRARITKTIDVPSWSVDGDGQVCIAVLAAADVADLMALRSRSVSETIDAEYILAYCARALVDPETHARVFVTDEQLGQLKAMPGGITKVFNEACDLNYDSKDAAEGLVKNSEETAGDDSGSGSRSTAATDTPTA